MDDEHSELLDDQEPQDEDNHLLHIDSEQAEVVFSALSSSRARRILTLLHRDPRSISALAAELDTSIQSIQYHIRNLRDAALIEVVETEYSPKGTEVKIFAPTSEALVLFSGPESKSDLKSHLRKLFAAIGALGIVSMGVYVVSDWLPGLTEHPGMETPIPHDSNGETPTPTPEIVTEASGIDPGIVFFVGGLAALVIMALVWRYF